MKRIPSASLAVHIMVVVLTASCAALAVFSIVSVRLNHDRLLAQLDTRLATLADIIGQNSTAALDFNDKQDAATVLEALKREPHIVSACLYSGSGALFAEYRRATDSGFCSAQLPRTIDSGLLYRAVLRPALQDNEIVGSISLTSDMRDIANQEHRLITTLLLLGLLSLGIAGASGLILQYRVSRPIRDLAHAMHKVTAEAGFDAQITVWGSKEIAQLAAGFNSMMSELRRRERIARLADDRLQEQARTDSLTALPNRRLFTEFLTSAISNARRKQYLMALLYIDLDGFKVVNDSLGHSIGDLLLCEVASRLRSRVRQSDPLARIGGDEFAVILTDLADRQNAGLIASSLLEYMSTPFHIDGHEITIGASIGISLLENSHQNGIDLLRQADSAMYAAKRGGRNRVAYFTEELRLMARERLTLENQLRGAVERGEIQVHYQPEFDSLSGAIVRFEALARWHHPQLGHISPSRFIPVAEESGLIHSLGSYVMEQACRTAASWQSISSEPVQIAVNVSPIQFNSDNIVSEVCRVLQKTGLPPRLLQIELTESVMMGSLQRSFEKMQSLRSLGVNLALDDFGTGYSCLSYLPELPFAAIKLDRSFVSKLSPASDSNKMIRSMVDLAHSMNMRVIAEGVEEKSQLDLVKELGVDEVQGFLLGRPGPNPSHLLEFSYHHSSTDYTSDPEAAFVSS
jgi:diguanylate cyclase (GGDEF)-like protein